MVFFMSLKVNDFVSKPCRSSDSFQFVPSEKVSLNLNELVKNFEDEGFFIEFNSSFLISMKISGKRVSLFKSGKVLVKDSDNEEETRKIAEKIYSLIK